MDTKLQIEALEDRLVEAMKTSNVTELDALLADSLIFTNQNGHLINKQDDLDTHRSGNLEIFSLETSARLIYVAGDVAVVSVVKDISGSFSGHAYVGQFRYTRIWKDMGNGWQVIAGHASNIIA